MKNKVYCEPLEVDEALTELGLNKSDLNNVVKYAASEKSFCTENDPIGFGNYIVYAKAARGLRETYCIGNKGWIKDDTNNQAAILHPHRKIRIVPCNFDEFAGNRLVDPSNRSPKGEISKKKVVSNCSDWLPNLPVIDLVKKEEFQTWILGMFVSDDGNITRAELSFPIEFEGDYYSKFARRIILLAGDENQPPRKQMPETEKDTFKIVDISIKRK